MEKIHKVRKNWDSRGLEPRPLPEVSHAGPWGCAYAIPRQWGADGGPVGGSIIGRQVKVGVRVRVGFGLRVSGVRLGYWVRVFK